MELESENLAAATPEPHSCKHCQKLIFLLPRRYRQKDKTSVGFNRVRIRQGWKPSLRAVLWLGSLGLDAPAGEEWRVFDVTMGEMREAAVQGCSLFDHLLGTSTADIPEATFLVGYFPVQESTVLFQVISQTLERNGRIASMKPLSTSWEQDFTICADAGSSASREAFGRPINRFSSSEQSLKLSRDWLHSCLMTHDICPKPNGKFMPTRLIAISNVGSSDYLILLECSDPEPYAALSYCWGNKKQVTTTSTNLQRHKSFLSFKDLPATVKDAITVVSKMGIRRLWIDCLCIIQDDDDDKAREIAKMPLIYSQATVTIAASNSKSVHEGFLRDRTPRQYFQLPYLCLDGKAGSVTLRRGKYEEHKQPLESRGWAFQERLLSPRILDYRSHHTEWVCHENKGARRLTDGNFEFTLSPLFSDDFEIFSDALLKGDTPSGKSTSSSEGKDNIDKYFQLWYKLVTTYTLRQLTIPSDRILAISAIANRFQPLLNDKYCAGHWKSRLDKELLWRVPFQESGLKQRPSEYQAPSWSWASISAPIDTELFAGETRLDKRREQRDDCFKILDCQIQLRSEEESNKSTEVHQFGAVISGALVAIGRVQQGELVWPGDKVRKYDQNGESGGATLKSTWVWRDAIEEELAKVHGFIPIFLLRVAQSPFHTALILRQKGPSVYSRLGIVNFTFENIPPRFSFGPGGRDVFQEELRWLDAGEVRTITIV